MGQKELTKKEMSDKNIIFFLREKKERVKENGFILEKKKKRQRWGEWLVGIVLEIEDEGGT